MTEPKLIAKYSGKVKWVEGQRVIVGLKDAKFGGLEREIEFQIAQVETTEAILSDARVSVEVYRNKAGLPPKEKIYISS